MRRDEPGINNLVSLVSRGGESEWAAPEDNRPHPSFLWGNVGTGRATSGGHLASDSLPVKVARDQGISTSGSQEEPPVWLSPSAFPDVNLNDSQVGNGCRERGGMGQEQEGVQAWGVRRHYRPFTSWESRVWSRQMSEVKGQDNNLTCLSNKKGKHCIFTHHAAHLNEDKSVILQKKVKKKLLARISSFYSDFKHFMQSCTCFTDDLHIVSKLTEHF